jgi:hypothetical protein
MTSNDVQRLKNDLLVEFGLFLAPLEELVRSTPAPTVDQCRSAVRRYIEGQSAWSAAVRKFRKQISYPNLPPGFLDLFHLDYEITGPTPYTTSAHLYAISGQIDVPSILASLNETLKKMRAKVYAHLDAIPVVWEAEVFKGTSPLAVYFRIKEVMGTAKTRIDYADRYMKDDIFPLYLRDLDRGLSIRLITKRGDNTHGVTHLHPVAILAKAEFRAFELIEVSPKNMHDRKLRVDDQIFVIGSGVSTGGKPPEYANEFAPADSSPTGHAEFDAVIASGTVV